MYVDTNGNFVWDPEGRNFDDTNEDIVYSASFASDDVFAGNFAGFVNPANPAAVGDNTLEFARVVTRETLHEEVVDHGVRSLAVVERGSAHYVLQEITGSPRVPDHGSGRESTRCAL